MIKNSSALIAEDHPASYRRCPIAKERQESRNKLINTRHQKQDEAPVGKKSDIKINKSGMENKQEQYIKSYAQIMKNVRKKGDITNKDILTLVLQR